MMRYRTQGTGDRGETGETGYTWDAGDTGEKGDTGLRFSIHMDNFLWNLTKMHASEKFKIYTRIPSEYVDHIILSSKLLIGIKCKFATFSLEGRWPLYVAQCQYLYAVENYLLKHSSNIDQSHSK